MMFYNYATYTYQARFLHGLVPKNFIWGMTEGIERDERCISSSVLVSGLRSVSCVTGGETADTAASNMQTVIWKHLYQAVSGEKSSVSARYICFDARKCIWTVFFSITGSSSLRETVALWRQASNVEQIICDKKGRMPSIFFVKLPLKEQNEVSGYHLSLRYDVTQQVIDESSKPDMLYNSGFLFHLHCTPTAKLPPFIYHIFSAGGDESFETSLLPSFKTRSLKRKDGRQCQRAAEAILIRPGD
jgi:hypothetical protein